MRVGSIATSCTLGLHAMSDAAGSEQMAIRLGLVLYERRTTLNTSGWDELPAPRHPTHVSLATIVHTVTGATQSSCAYRTTRASRSQRHNGDLLGSVARQNKCTGRTTCQLFAL